MKLMRMNCLFTCLLLFLPHLTKSNTTDIYILYITMTTLLNLQQLLFIYDGYIETVDRATIYLYSLLQYQVIFHKAIAEKSYTQENFRETEKDRELLTSTGAHW